MALPLALSLPAQVAAQAELTVSNLRQTNYQHTEHIDVDGGIYDCDCNGFAGFALTRAASSRISTIRAETARGSSPTEWDTARSSSGSMRRGGL